MYKCSTCNHRTEDIDEPPCSGHPFVPIEIKTIHKSINGKNGKILICTGKPPKGNAVFLGGNYGISCIRCRAAMRESWLSSEKAENEEAIKPKKTKKKRTEKSREEPKLSTKNNENLLDLLEPQNPDKLPSDLE